MSDKEKTSWGGPAWAEALGIRLRRLREDAGLTQEALAKAIGLGTQNTITRIERGAASGLSYPVLHRLLAFAADHDVSADELLMGRRFSEVMTDHAFYAELGRRYAEALMTAIGDEESAQACREIFRHPSAVRTDKAFVDLGKSIVERTTMGVAKAVEQDTEPPGEWQITQTIEPGFRVIDREELSTLDGENYIPVIGRLAAGQSVAEDTVEADSHEPGDADTFLLYTGRAPSSAFALRVVGDSMEPEYSDGDMVVVDGARPVRSGICCVIYARDGGDRIARLKKLTIARGRAHLASTNPAVPTITLPADSIEAYKVIDHLPRLRQGSGGQARPRTK